MSEETFLYDEFFATDTSVTIYPVIRGRTVPMQVRTVLSLDQRQQAAQQAQTRALDPKTGQLTVTGVDETRATVALLEASIVSWPFTYADGRAVPVDDTTIRKFLGSGVDTILNGILRVQQGGDLGPFGKPSEIPFDTLTETSTSPQVASPSDSPATSNSDGPQA